ncbi:MAG: GNAT family N-acetyltransferase [Alphaproteobacteria bacterium]|nr:GNAT family N-acetyltransferase [Alphaproteobacteria bacterium]
MTLRDPDPAPAIIIRPAGAADGEALSALCALHAAYERAPFDPRGHAVRLAEALSAPVPRVAIHVAERVAERVAEKGGDLVGFVSMTEEFETWSADAFLHMDCLFLKHGYRGRGLGRRLIDVVTAEARRRGLPTVKWQTPSWNADAKRFYAGLGATATDKTRYALPVALNGSRGS